jgi:hypothetical protein
VSDHLREAGVIVAHLSRALLDGSRDLSTVPSLIKRVIAEDMWRQRVDPASGRKIPERPFRAFAEFIATPAAKGGLGSSIRQLRGLCESDTEALDAIDRVTQRSRGGDRRSPDFNVDNVHVERPAGNSESAALRRLRKSAPELHAEVLAERLSAHAAMVKAGFRPRTVTVRPDDPQSAARTLRRHMSPDAVAELAHILAAP